jgi:NAD(P)-dependent dehydrogenase (short-subunit alcohol dehydrogenase family)
MAKTLFITGASRGLGRAIAEAALARGERVALTARRPEAVSDLVDGYPDTAAAFALDVTDALAAQRAVASAVDRWGGIDALITNAGYSDISSVEDTDLAALRAVVDTNFYGVVNVVKAALPTLRRAGSGHIVQISSVSGRLAPAPGLAPYVAAKFAAEGFLEAVALEVAGFGVRVTIIEPGRMATEISSAMTIAQPSEPYAELLAPFTARFVGGQSAGTKAADAADFVLRALELDDPPLRLPLGTAAFQAILAAEQKKMDELQRWSSFSHAADSPA